MVAELEDSKPQTGNGAAPAEPPVTPPLIGQDLAAPPQDPLKPGESVPPPSVPPPVAPAQPVAPAAQAQPQAVAAAQPAAPASEVSPAAAQVPPAAPVPAITPMPPPPGWYGDIFGSPPRWWDGTIWTEHVLIPLPSAEPAVAAPAADDDVQLTFIDNAVISFSLAPDWAKFLAAAVVTAVLALIGLGILNDDSSDDVPDGFVPQTPELDDSSLPQAPTTPTPTEPEGSIPR
jgi:hypothetical protein